MKIAFVLRTTNRAFFSVVHHHDLQNKLSCPSLNSLQLRNISRCVSAGCGDNTTLQEGGVRGVPIPQNRTEKRVNTAQNNIRKPQTALKLPENF